MDRLGQAWRRTDDAREPIEGDSSWFVTQELDYELMIKLGVCKALPKQPPKKRGPKPKKTEPASTAKAKIQIDNSSHTNARSAAKSTDHTGEKPASAKRKPGRPRIHPLSDPNVPKRPVGRPRIHPLPDPDAPKRPVGRPRCERSKEISRPPSEECGEVTCISHNLESSLRLGYNYLGKLYSMKVM